MSQPQSLYVHIPFCRHICSYCDFAKVFYKEDWADAYLQRLADELEARKANRSFETVYIGGGSPSALNEGQLAKLLDILEKPLSKAKEATIEVNPEDLNEQKVQLLKKKGISRISIGVQTFQQPLLKRLGRHHDLSMIRKAVASICQSGIQRLSFDFIYGLPHQTLADVQADLEILASFPQISHVSFYTLILEEHTRFYLEKTELQDEEWLLQAQRLICRRLRELGFVRYEVSNFSKPGQASLHNLVYWHNERYIGIGCGASGYIGSSRYDNTKSLSHYLAGKTTYQTHLLTIEEQRFEALMLGLRLVGGISVSQFEKQCGCQIEAAFKGKLKQYLNSGLLVIEDGFLKTTARGMDVLDEILVSIL